ncbi:O-antigen polymerase [Alkaliflexus imshenetskii]|uniref:O-antigen polymerase n=1 Tax=Alkaliflexus imshenetskii TaxID=286730 RepID=UPI00047CC6CC|nr:O-antigen polymerase [Alkaliflexus imshenetskii]
MGVLIANFLLYFIYFLFNVKGTGLLFKALLMMYMFVSLSSLFIWESGIYSFLHRNHIITNEISIYPFLYLFATFIFLFEPIKKFNESKIEMVVLDDKFRIEILGKLCIVFGLGLLVLLLLFVDYNASLENASEVYRDSEDGELAMPVFLYRLYTLHRLLYPFILLLGFYYLSFKSEFRFKTILLLVAAVIPKVFVSIVLVSRGGLFFIIIELMTCFLIFRRFIPQRTKRLLYVGSLFIVALLTSVVVIFTASRFGNSAFGPLMSVFKYFGESFLNFNSTFWGNIQEHPMSEFKFPFLYQFYDIPRTFLSRSDQYSFFSDMTGTNVLLFKTIVGDFYVEFGIVLGALILFLISRLFIKFVRFENTIRFSSLIPFLYYYELVFIGVFDLLWHGKFLFQLIVFTSLIYVFIRYRIKLGLAFK